MSSFRPLRISYAEDTRSFFKFRSQFLYRTLAQQVLILSTAFHRFEKPCAVHLAQDEGKMSGIRVRTKPDLACFDR